MSHSESPVDNPLRVALGVLGFTLLFAVMTTFIKLGANEGIPVSEMMFWRFAFGLIPVLIYLGPQGVKREIRHKEWMPLSTRAFMGMIAMWCTFQSFAMLPVAEATTLHFTSTFLLTLLAIPVLKEKVGPWRGGAIVMGFIGVLLVLRPDMAGDKAGQIIALCAALIMAMNMLLVRTLQNRVSAQALTLYFHILGTLVLLPFVIINWEMPSFNGWLYMLGAGLSAGYAQILLNRSYLIAPAAFVSSFSYIQIVFVTLAGWLVFGNIPTHSFLLGAGIIVAGGVLIAVREALLRRKIQVIEEAL